MYDKFEKFGLNGYPPEIRGRFNSFITTQFDDSLSVEMQIRSIIKWAIDNFDETVNQTNHLIDFINDLIEYMNEFIETFDGKYQETILDKMQEWYDNGELETLINESLDTKYHEMDNRLTSQLTLKADKTYVDEHKADKANPEFRTNTSQFPSLSEDVLPTSTVSLGTGWSGTFTSGFTHTPGNTEPLVFTFNQLIENNIYKIDIAISKPDMSDTNGQSDYWITLGGSDEFETYRGIVESQTWGIINTGLNRELVIRPFEDFNGSLTITMQRVLEFAEPYLTFIDENGSRAQDFRPSLLGVDSLYIGRNSGRRSLSMPGEQNTGIGSDTLLYNTTGFWNTAIGNRALLSNSVGSRNIAIGRVSLTNNTTGDRNVAIGTFAMNRNTTGRNNIAIGADSLWYNTTGDSNVGVGLLALGNNRTGNRNVGVGDNALQYNREGSNNTAIGDNALYRVVESVGNVGVGSGAFRRLQTGERNTIIGTNAGVNQTDGSRNILIGYASGSSATVGDNNILIGYGVEKRNPDADRELNIGGIIRSYDMSTGEIELRKLVITQLPTTAPEREGSVWNDNGTLKIV